MDRDEESGSMSDSNEELTQQQINARIIYNADHIMTNILENIPRYQDRLKLMRVSVRFQHLLQKSLKPPNVQYETLSIILPGIKAKIDIGSFSAVVPCLTYGNSRSLAPPHQQNWRQSEELMTLLHKLSFANKTIKYVDLGGGSMGYQEDDLSITGDLIEYFDQLSNLHSLKMYHCDMKQSGIQRIMSDECSFKHKLKQLTLIGCGNTEYAIMIGKELRDLRIDQFKLSRGQQVLEKIDQLGIHLDKISFEIGYSQGTVDEIELLTGLSQKCAQFELTFRANTSTNIPAYLELVSNIDKWENVTKLQLFTWKYSRQPNVAMPSILEKVTRLKNLEQLGISEMFSPVMLEILAAGIGNLTKLKYLCFIDHSLAIDIRSLIENLPLSLESIEMISIKWQSNLEELFCNKFSNSLKQLKVAFAIHTSIPDLFTTLVTKMKNLEKFEFYHEVPWQLLSHVLDNKSIDSFHIDLRSALPLRVQIILQDNFVNYRYTNCCITELVCSKRKPSSLTLPLEPFSPLVDDGEQW